MLGEKISTEDLIYMYILEYCILQLNPFDSHGKVQPEDTIEQSH